MIFNFLKAEIKLELVLKAYNLTVYFYYICKGNVMGWLDGMSASVINAIIKIHKSLIIHFSTIQESLDYTRIHHYWNTLCIFIARSVRGNVTSLTMGIWGFMISAGTPKKMQDVVSTYLQILLPLRGDSDVLAIFKSCYSSFLNITWNSGGNYSFTGPVIKNVPSKFEQECA